MSALRIVPTKAALGARVEGLDRTRIANPVPLEPQADRPELARAS